MMSGIVIRYKRPLSTQGCGLLQNRTNHRRSCLKVVKQSNLLVAWYQVVGPARLVHCQHMPCRPEMQHSWGATGTCSWRHYSILRIQPFCLIPGITEIHTSVESLNSTVNWSESLQTMTQQCSHIHQPMLSMTHWLWKFGFCKGLANAPRPNVVLLATLCHSCAPSAGLG